MTIITIDIETLPTDNQDVIAELSASIQAPATHKKPESIAAWMEENHAALLAEKVAKTALDGLYGRIACIAWKIGNGETHVTKSDNEEDAINEFFDNVDSVVDSYRVCGHNIAGFDLPFLRHRAIVIDTGIPHSISKAMTAKPWDSVIADTMLMWSPDREKRKSLDALCKALGIPGKGDMDGSKVAETWKTDKAKVREYCKDDVDRAYALYRRLSVV